MAKQNKFVFNVYGFDPYNTTNAGIQGKLFVRSFNGPLGPIAYRCQKSWDYLPGLSAAEKIKHYGVRS